MGNRIMDLMKCLIVLVVGVLLFLFGLKGRSNAKKLKEACTATAVGEVISVRETSDSDENGSYTTYYPTLKYTVNEVEYTAEVDGMAQAPEIGKLYQININPNNPAELVTGNNGAIISNACIVFGIIMVIIAVTQLIKI